MRAPWMCSFFFGFFLIFSSISAESNYFSPAKLSSTWTNNESFIRSINFRDGSRIRVILNNEKKFRCGFFCNGTCTSYLFAIVVINMTTTRDSLAVIWSANRDNLVREGAILNFTATGELMLQDVDGNIVWTTNTTGKSVASMNLTEDGNLGLLNVHNLTVWQSFDHPTDCLLPGQKLFQGQKLIPSVSSTNWTPQVDLYSLQFNEKGLFFYVGSNPPQVYYGHTVNGLDEGYLELRGRSLCLVISSSRPNYCPSVIDIPPAFPFEYIKLLPDGHLKAFGWETDNDLLLGHLGGCSYPLACGRNAICSADQQCSCPISSTSPATDYFRAVNDRQPNKGCSQVTPLTCNATQNHTFIELNNVTYFTFTSDMEDVDIETCKQACLNNCSCKAALIKYGSNSSGDCYLPSELFTITSLDAGVLPQNVLFFIKVLNSSIPQSHGRSSNRKILVATILGSTIGSLMLLIMVVGFTRFILQKKNMNSESEEEYLDQVSGMPTRFSYDELKTATENFSKKLGEGGFGSVFEGTLKDGSKIAVKCLQGLVHVKKSFLAEVESIGSIHHVNLVRLRGFCARKSQQLLVYEFMSNGSLDQWIYYGDRKQVLPWISRKKIILDIAKGLTYLHEDCRQKIIHLDIKPQNILLDADFNAKVSDFGLSKLIDRDQSQVMTTMRGTPGYLAPEWLSSIITEKVDVYSFGILLLEILCGRKIVDRSQPEESWHLLRVFQRCWEQETLLNIVDRYSEDMQEHGTEVMEMMKLASWCLQTDFTKRPSMSTVIKVLEGVISVELDLDYNFSYQRMQETTYGHEKSSQPVLPPSLSAPR
ncbi:G-type lectin S-receptor-like serine/threonine-protein kinase SD2-5 [Lactuca sativa]|nr:G-type lectin S-receptor-like serine/threonine-protein kinase SD2-5 [Lactuca sativa]